MIYLDHNATTPVLPEVRDAMLPFLADEWGNPSSSYRFGSRLKSVLETAREQVAALLGASPREILFTSCATESNNAAINAALKANQTKRHIVTSAVEHSSVLAYCQALERDGIRVTYLPVDREGLLKLADLENAINIVLTWNCRHLANPHVTGRMRAFMQQNGLILPEICTPVEIMGE